MISFGEFTWAFNSRYGAHEKIDAVDSSLISLGKK